VGVGVRVRVKVRTRVSDRVTVRVLVGVRDGVDHGYFASLVHPLHTVDERQGTVIYKSFLFQLLTISHIS
jgi:hypothetical protein